ncbi:RNA polymerase sigma factor [Chitinophaga sp. sic0106]|uniref:RNA polymerase sigma factor n=1 Tax=Chitinophaga sp. sic0106 TaxID=2854785 RepID=UPI001C473479|nr:RNA polymerase sigma-70 factor [Chitinophaga sp. sic0106]MBV7533030.1 RNA polymerase sigma-70 factor [Chitinophaga sp. sic0106]
MSTDQPYVETDLLHRVAAGEEDAFNQLFAQYRNDVYLHALTYTKSPEFSEELVLDIFLKIWENREKLTEITHFKGYLFILSRNQVISAMRKCLLQPVTGMDLSYQISDWMEPDKRLEYKEAQALLEKAIATLSPQQRTAFTLSRAEGKTYEEIAAIMGISKRTVNYHIVAALNALRQHLHNNSTSLVIYLAAIFWEL